MRSVKTAAAWAVAAAVTASAGVARADDPVVVQVGPEVFVAPVAAPQPGMAYMPATAATVTFRPQNDGDDGGTVVLSRTGQGGPIPGQLVLAPGQYDVEFRNGSSFNETLMFPPGASTVRVRYRTTGRLVGGIVLVSVGPVLMLASGVAFAVGSAESSGFSTATADPASANVTGAVLLTLGGASLVTGIVLLATTRGNHAEVIPNGPVYSLRSPQPAVRFLGAGISPVEHGAVMGAALAF